jgi:hypothetical protein
MLNFNYVFQSTKFAQNYWDILVEHKHFPTKYKSLGDLMMEAVSSSEMSASICQTARCYIR